MAKKASLPSAKPERVIALMGGESATGKSFWIANLKRALIFDTDIGGGLSYLDARIERNESERIEVGSYVEIMDHIRTRRNDGRLKNYVTVAIDHLTTLHQEAVLRYNPNAAEDFGKSYEKANREWRKIRETVRVGDFNLVCTSHMKSKYENQKVVGITTDASKNINADFTMVLYLMRQPSGAYPSTARVEKWRRDPEDTRGAVPTTFPFTMEKFVEMHGFPMEGEREEVELASDGQVKELERLIELVKLPEGTTEKWLTKAKVESWAEMSSETIQKCIDALLAKVQNAKQEGVAA